VNLRFIVMKHSEHQVPLARDFARSLGVDVLTLRKFHFVPGTGGGTNSESHLGSSLVPSEIRYSFRRSHRRISGRSSLAESVPQPVELPYGPLG